MREVVLHLSDKDYLDFFRVLTLIETEAELEGKTLDKTPKSNGELLADMARRYEQAVVDNRIPTKLKVCPQGGPR